MIGLTILRVGTGSLMLYGHGLAKLMNFPNRMHTFADPLGIGSTASLTLAVFAEFFCALLLVLGIGTRAVAVPLLITMLVAVFIVHAQDPFANKEMALLYAIPFLTLMLSGGGNYQLGPRLGGVLARYS